MFLVSVQIVVNIIESLKRSELNHA